MGKLKEKTLEFFDDDKILILILLLSLSLSLFYAFHFRIKPQVDARAYDNIAQNIVAGNGFRESMEKDLAHDYAIARVGPLYQFFLAGIYKIFGHSYPAVWVFQGFLHSLTALLVYLVSLLVLSGFENKRKMALTAAAIIAFYPDLIENSAMLLSETLYLFLVCFAVYLFFRYFYRKNILTLLGLGLVFGLAVLSRPPVLIFAPIMLFYFYSKKLFWPGLVFIMIVIAVFVPWTARNYIVYKSFMPFGAAGNFNFWIGNWHGASGEQGENQEQYQFLATHEIKEVNSESMKQFKNFLLEYPAEFIKLTLLRVNKYFSVIRPMGFWFYQTGLGQLLFLLSSGLASVILFIFGFGGLIRSIKLKNEVLYYLLAFAVATPLVVFITVVETRYRFQIYPFLAVFAGFFIFELFGKPKWWFNKILRLAIFLIVANGLLDLFLAFAKFKERLGNFF